MLKETTLYTAICDGCDWEYPYQFMSEKELEDFLPKADWHDTGNFHFCPNCYTIDENNEVKFTYKPKNNETND